MYISQAPNIDQQQDEPGVLISIPSLDARVTLWKEVGKTKVETSNEETRSLLKSFLFTHLLEVVVP